MKHKANVVNPIKLVYRWILKDLQSVFYMNEVCEKAEWNFKNIICTENFERVYISIPSGYLECGVEKKDVMKAMATEMVISNYVNKRE